MFSTSFPTPFYTNTQSSHFPSIRHTHTHAIVFKNCFSLCSASIFFSSSSPPHKQKLLIQSFIFLDEILHKLTSCHFILQNKTLNDLYPKILLFSPPRANCTIHQRTVTQIHDLSCHLFSLKKPVLAKKKKNLNFLANLTIFFLPISP
jgi:hypothetical protein